MSILKKPAILALGIAAAGCGFVRPPTAIDLDDEPVVVHAVLVTGSDRATVLVTRVGPEEYVPGRTYVYDPGIEPVSGAEVTLITPEGPVRLEEAPAGFSACYGSYGSSPGGAPELPARPGCYGALLLAPVRSGVAYGLQIRLPDGRVVEGEATPPPALASVDLHPAGPVVVRPGYSNFDFPGQVQVRFAAPAEVAGVGLAIRPVGAFLGGRHAADVECTIEAPPFVVSTLEAEGGGVLPLQGVRCIQGEGDSRRSVSPDSLHAELYATAYDAAFMRYHAAVGQREAKPGAAAQGISGALGLFAGVTTREHTITLVYTD